MSFLLFTDRQPQLLWGWAGDLFGFDGCCWCCPTRKAAGGNCGQVWCTWLSVSGDWKLSCEILNSLCHQIALAKRADKVYPVPGPWINGGVIKSLANMAAGTKPPGSTDCEDNDGLAISLPTALASNSQDLPLKVIESTKTDRFGFCSSHHYWPSDQVANLLTTCPTAVRHLPLQLQILTNHLEGVEKPVQAALAKMKDSVPEEVSNM